MVLLTKVIKVQSLCKLIREFYKFDFGLNLLICKSLFYIKIIIKYL